MKKQFTISNIKVFFIALIAFSGIAFGANWIFNIATSFKTSSTTGEPKMSRAKIQLALQEADQKASDAINKRVATFSSFIESRKSGAKPFSEEIVSLYGKWRAVNPYLPFADKEGHKRYVIEKFEQYIFSNSDLASQVKIAVEGSVKDLEGIENDLAVTLRQEILERSLVPKDIPIAAEDFKKQTTEGVVDISRLDAVKSVGNLVVSDVVSQVSTQVLIRLGVSAGVLTAGAANSWWSFGGTFVISLMVDTVWQWFDNPAGDIEIKMIESLNTLSVQSSSAIRQELTNAVSQRREIWKKSIEKITP
jgi:hypothetical protein